MSQPVLVGSIEIAALVDRIARSRLHCPDCKGSAIHRHGVANGLQRYRCQHCGRTFNGLTGTPLARLRLKRRWLAYLDCLRDPACTVKSAADMVGVHPNTSFRWRHRFLQWTKLDRPGLLHGIVEAVERHLPESHKGAKSLDRTASKRGDNAESEMGPPVQVSIVHARDRAGQTIDFVAGRGALRAVSLHQHLLPKLECDVLLVSDNHAAYRRFARQAGIDHRLVNPRSQARREQAIHLRNVDSYHGRFTGWLRHFRGVATRYLENYLGWRWAIDLCRIATAQQFLRAALGSPTANGESAQGFWPSRHTCVWPSTRVPRNPSRPSAPPIPTPSTQL